MPYGLPQLASWRFPSLASASAKISYAHDGLHTPSRSGLN